MGCCPINKKSKPSPPDQNGLPYPIPLNQESTIFPLERRSSHMDQSSTFSAFNDFYAAFKTIRWSQDLRREFDSSEPLFWFIDKPSYSQSQCYEISKFWLHLQNMQHQYVTAPQIDRQFNNFINLIRCHVAENEQNSLQNVKQKNVKEWLKRSHIMSTILNYTLRKFDMDAWNSIIFFLMVIFRTIKQKNMPRTNFTKELSVCIKQQTYRKMKQSVGQNVQLLRPLELNFVMPLNIPPDYCQVILKFQNYMTYTYLDTMTEYMMIYSLSRMKIKEATETPLGKIITIVSADQSLQKTIIEDDYDRFGVLISKDHFRQYKNVIDKLDIDSLVSARKLMNEHKYKEASQFYGNCIVSLSTEEIQKKVYLMIEQAECLEILGQWDMCIIAVQRLIHVVKNNKLNTTLEKLVKLMWKYWEKRTTMGRKAQQAYVEQIMGDPKNLLEIRCHIVEYRYKRLFNIDVPEMSEQIKKALKSYPLKHLSMMIGDHHEENQIAKLYELTSRIEREVVLQNDASANILEAERIAQQGQKHYIYFLKGLMLTNQVLRRGLGDRQSWPQSIKQLDQSTVCITNALLSYSKVLGKAEKQKKQKIPGGQFYQLYSVYFETKQRILRFIDQIRDKMINGQNSGSD